MLEQGQQLQKMFQIAHLAYQDQNKKMLKIGQKIRNN